MDDTTHYLIPGETKVRDNNWKEVIKALAIQPSTMIERFDWKADAAALAKSPEEFVNRANTWPSSLHNNNNEYHLGTETEEDFVGPLAHPKGLHGLRDWGIRIPQLSGEEEIKDFAIYTRMIHKYCRNVKETFYSDKLAKQKAVINAALLIATIEFRCGRDLRLTYTQSDNTPMSEICGLIGKKTDGSDMTDKEQADFLSALADNYVNQLQSNTRQSVIISDKKTYGDYKKEVDNKKSKEIEERIDKMSPEEQRALLSRLLSQRN